MTPEQARALAGLADALAECERVGMPVVQEPPDGDLRAEAKLLQRVWIGADALGSRGRSRAYVGIKVIRTFGGDNRWHLDLADPS